MFAAKYLQMGAKIRYYRNIRGITQTEFAQSLGVTYQYLSKIENGTAKPSMDLLFLIAEKLRVDVADILKTDKILLEGKHKD